MLIMHNNKYLPLTGLLNLLQLTIQRLQPALHSPSSGKIFRYLWCEMTSVCPIRHASGCLCQSFR